MLYPAHLIHFHCLSQRSIDPSILDLVPLMEFRPGNALKEYLSAVIVRHHLYGHESSSLLRCQNQVLSYKTSYAREKVDQRELI